ncbi:zinc finger protein, putative [Plasmodium ovale]|uniref:Zinc finger protein, putative n=2 Tax=Plasmodium ovale TaxID=36330 RepID=A0A1A8WQZ2_PLAOA|nr:zinc finger protein, putative [Plasmodium ovale curtisi]SBT00466.1 zinc finger protein, putative [Plasmodium ovale curtisi]SCP04233.1 zinc finger protein, putative [Plasmodium ovale]
MSTFANNAGSYRNRTLNVSPKCQNINYKIQSLENGYSIFCPTCNVPFNSKIRVNPCYHILCNKCYEVSMQQQICPICSCEISDVEFFFADDKIYVCPFNDCKKGYINERSFNYHIYFKHEFLKENEYQMEKGSNSSISDIQHMREVSVVPGNEIYKSDIISYGAGSSSGNGSNNKVGSYDIHENELAYAFDKNDINNDDPFKNNNVQGIYGEYTNTTEGNKNSFFPDVHNNNTNTLEETGLELNYQTGNNFSLDDNNKLSHNNTILNITSNNNFNSKYSNTVQTLDKWNYNNVPFKSDFNTFNIPSNENVPADNPNNQSGKEDLVDDYDNLEDLM